MAETTLDLAGVAKPGAYAGLRSQIETVLDAIPDEITVKARISSASHTAMHHLWTGFYRVVAPCKLLRVGPSQGNLGCLEIEFGRDVCGTAAATGTSVF